MISSSVQPRILPVEQEVLSFLKQHVETAHIDSTVLEIVAKSLSGQPFFRYTSLNGLKLSIKTIDVLNLDSTLNRCADGEKPIIQAARHVVPVA